MVAAKISNDAFAERQRLEREAAERARAAAERRRRLEQQSLALLDQLSAEQQQLERVGAMIARLTRSAAPLGDRAGRLLAWLQSRATAIDNQLEPAAIERRLETAGLFGDDADV